jgi:hypothetical protein
MSATKSEHMPDKRPAQKGHVSDKVQDLVSDTFVGKGKNFGVQRPPIPYDESVPEIPTPSQSGHAQHSEFRFKTEGLRFRDFVEKNFGLKPVDAESLRSNPASRIINDARHTKGFSGKDNQGTSMVRIPHRNGGIDPQGLHPAGLVLFGKQGKFTGKQISTAVKGGNFTSLHADFRIPQTDSRQGRKKVFNGPNFYPVRE